MNFIPVKYLAVLHYHFHHRIRSFYGTNCKNTLNVHTSTSLPELSNGRRI
jgi:hypothetical protein